MNAYQAASTAVGYTLPLAVPMRGTITFTPTFTQQTNCSGGTMAAAGAYNAVLIYSTATAAGNAVFAGTFTASADL